MIKLEAYISEVEYDKLLQRLLPSSGGVTGAVAQGILAAMPQAEKDKYAAELLNSRAHEVCEKLEAQARREGIGLKIASLHAEVK